MIEFTPEQKAEMDRRIAEAEVAALKRYDAEAHKFREWINKHDALWAARRFGAIGLIVGAAAMFYGLGLFHAVFG